MEGLSANGLTPGLRVVVTAGAGGIGRAIVEALTAQEARVYVCDIDEDALARLRADMPEVRTGVADVSRPQDVDALFGEVEAAFGGLDVLVNNAGIAGPTVGVEEISDADWQRTIEVNLNGQFYCLRRAVPLLKRADGGVIVNISSVAGRLGYAYRLPYAATKWAIVGMTESLAKELGPANISVNAVLPGIVEGPRIERVIAARAQALGVDYATMEQEYLQKVSLRRMVSPHDVAATVAFLCSPSGRNISGQPISVCGNVETL